MSTKRNISSFNQVLHSVFERLEESQHGKERTLFDHWPEWVGEKAAQHSRPVKVKNGCLLVRVDHPTWLYELNQGKSRTLLRKIKRRVGEGVVKRIVFRLGDI